MRELHVIALSEDGRSVLLATSKKATDGGFRLKLDGKLTAALRGDVPRVGETSVRDTGVSPKDIQARMRAGESAQQIADAAGVPVARVERFAGPVLSERERIIDEARAAYLTRGRLGPSLLPLGDAVEAALAETASLRPDSVEWSARRLDSGHWLVQISYVARARTRTASWVLDPSTRSITASDAGSSVLGHRGDEPIRRVGTTTSAGRQAAPRKGSARKAAVRKAAVRKAPARKAPVRATTAKTPSGRTAASPRPKTKAKAAPAEEIPVFTTQPAVEIAVPVAPPVRKAAPKKAAPKKAAKKAAKKALAKRPAAKAPPAEVPVEPVVAPVAQPALEPAARLAEPAAPDVPIPADGPPALRVVPRPVDVGPEPEPEPEPEPAVEPDAPEDEPAASPAPRRRAAGERASVPAWADVLLGITPRSGTDKADG